MFCYSSLLVEAGLVNEVNLSFLIVGHTHCNLDQEFSFHAKYINKSAWIGSPIAMQELYLTASRHAEDERIKKGEKRRITIGVQLRYVFDWTAFFKAVANTNITYYQVPHRFRIKLHQERAICQYMLFTDESLSREVWLPVPPTPSVAVEYLSDPLIHESFIQLEQFAVVNGLPSLKRFMGLKGDIGSFISSSRSQISEDSLTLAQNLKNTMKELLELERVALASTMVNFDIQEGNLALHSLSSAITTIMLTLLYIIF